MLVSHLMAVAEAPSVVPAVPDELPQKLPESLCEAPTQRGHAATGSVDGRVAERLERVRRHFLLSRRTPVARSPRKASPGCGTALDQQYQQLKAQVSGEIASQQVHIERSQGAIKVVRWLANAGGGDCQDGTDPGVADLQREPNLILP
jgi:hypothetical protein